MSDTKSLQPEAISAASFILTKSSNKSIQIFQAADYSHYPTYAIIERSKLSLLTSKPDFTLSKLDQNAVILRDSDLQKGSTAAEMRFLKPKSIPYVQRIAVEIINGPTHTLTASGLKDFSFTVDELRFTWSFSSKPNTSLVLFQSIGDSEPDLLARFSYSKYGTDAVAKQEVGQLDIFGFQSGAKLDEHKVEMILSSCQMIVVWFLKMGKHYKMVEGSRSLALPVSDRMKWFQGVTAEGVIY
jgi:hypothetical protein